MAKPSRNQSARVALMLLPTSVVNHHPARTGQAGFPHPAHRSMFGDAILLLFLLAQLLDGVFTYVGIATFGAAIEGNPLLAWYIAMFGPGLALLGAKAVAVGCGATLHVCARHRTVGVLTLIYLGVAVWPWMLIIWS